MLHYSFQAIRERGRKEMENSKAHILVIPFPIQGHINPMMQFSKRLAAKGPKLTLITITTTITKSMKPEAGPVTIESISDGYENEPPESLDALAERFKDLVSKTLPNIVQKQRNLGHPVKVIVYDSIFPWVLDIAKGLGVSAAPFFTQSCAVCAIYYNVHEGKLMVPPEGVNVSLPALPLLETNDLPDMKLYDNLLRININQFSNIEKADWLLFNSFDKLEDEVVKWMANKWPIKTVGPTIPSIYLDNRLADDKDYGISLFKPNIDDCMNWLDSKEDGSVIYISFGSLANLGEDQMAELAMGLLSSNHYFLWVVRASEESKLPENFVSEIRDKGLIVNWCSQLKVLAHGAVGCFMTHCGWNSTLEALSSGVPMVAMPQWTDQPTNSKFIKDVWGVGVRVRVNHKGIVTREEIEMCLKEVMEGEKRDEFMRNAGKWKELAKEAVDDGGSSDKNIDDLVSRLVSA